MNNGTVSRVLGGLILALSGCAQSPISSDEDPIDERDATIDASEIDANVRDSELDEPEPDAGEDASKPRPDAGDASRPRDDGGPKPSDGGTDGGPGDSGPTDSGTPDAGPPPCPSGQTRCGDACVNKQDDEANCGMCGKACGANQMCKSGSCMDNVPMFDVPNGCTSKTFNGHGYGFCTAMVTWEAARQTCRGAGLDLAIIANKAENDFIRTNGDSWIGATDRANEGSYVSIVPGTNNNGSAIPYSNWVAPEPNNVKTCDGLPFPILGCFGTTRDEDCAVVAMGGNWYDADCDASHGFICETH